jgi:transposase
VICERNLDFCDKIMRAYDTFSNAFDAREELRREEIQAILDGRTQAEVGKLCGVTRQAVCKWVKAYRAKGDEGLKTKRSGRPKGASLLPLQAMQIAMLIAEYCPEELGLPFYLWTREAVAQLIEQRFSVRFSMRTVGAYLKRWGFTPQRTVCRAFQTNLGEVRRWFVEEYPNVK